jgi:hypothetical protein
LKYSPTKPFTHHIKTPLMKLTFLFFAVLGLELRALSLLGRCSTISATLSAQKTNLYDKNFPLFKKRRKRKKV